MNAHYPFYWERFCGADGWVDPKKVPPGADLSALRSGLGRAPGTVPAMWRLHGLDISEDQAQRGYADPRYAAEHHALTLYGVHQQSVDRPMHRPGVGVGSAVRLLHVHNRPDEDGNSEAIDRRFFAAVTAGSVDEVAHHLRGLIQLLRSLKRPAALDYTKLVDDLRRWDHAEQREHVRLRWGRDYVASPPYAESADEPQPA